MGLVAFGIWRATRKNAETMKKKMHGGPVDPGGVRFDPFGGAGGAAAKKKAEREAKKAAWEKRRKDETSLRQLAAVETGGRRGGGFNFARGSAKVSPHKGAIVSKPVKGKKPGLKPGGSMFNVGSADQQFRERDLAQQRDWEKNYIPEDQIDSSFVWEGASKRGGWDEFGTGPKGTA